MVEQQQKIWTISSEANVSSRIVKVQCAELQMQSGNTHTDLGFGASELKVHLEIHSTDNPTSRQGKGVGKSRCEEMPRQCWRTRMWNQ